MFILAALLGVISYGLMRFGVSEPRHRRRPAIPG
jgi:hypothetical protein